MPISYAALKWLHAVSAILSLSLFLLRGAWMFRAAPPLDWKLTRVAPHVVDTALLLSAIALVWQLGGWIAIATQSWLAAKIAALFVYIALGTVALKRGRTLRIRRNAFFAALIVFAYIVSVAVSKSPAGFWSLF